jgi:hypothetical protein
MTGIAACCARAARGRAAADPATAAKKSRRLIAYPAGSAPELQQGYASNFERQNFFDWVRPLCGLEGQA